MVSNFNYERFFVKNHTQLRDVLEHKQKNWENLPAEENSRRSRWFTVFKQQLLLEATTFIKIQRGTWLKLETKFLLKLRATKNKKFNRIAVPSEHQSTNISTQLDTSLKKFLDCSVSFLKMKMFIFNDWTVKFIDYRASPIPAAGFEIPLTLNFKCPRYIIHTKMKVYVHTLPIWLQWR